MPSCLGGEENGINLVAFGSAEKRGEMQPRLTASCRFDPYLNSNNGGCSEAIRDTAVTDTKTKRYENYPCAHRFHFGLLRTLGAEFANSNYDKVHGCGGGR